MRVTVSMLLAVLAAAFATAAIAAQRSGIPVTDAGKDGDERYYAAVCPGDHRVILVHDYKKHKLCYTKVDGQPAVCLNTDNADAVAVEACRNTQ